MANFIENWLRGIDAALLTDFFIALILLMFFVGILCSYYKKAENFTQYAPTLLTSIGILGTFAGIISGLLHFNTDSKQIDASIPLLLEGLKTAFTSSLVGMAFSILYKVVAPLTQKKSQESPEDLFKQQTALLETLVKQHDASLTSFDQLKGSLDKFAGQISSSATEQVVSALKDIVKDFNQHLSDQFGENFQELNLAAQTLVKWQTEHKSDLENIVTQQEKSAEQLTNAQHSMSALQVSYRDLPGTMEQLVDIQLQSKKQFDSWSKQMSAIVDINKNHQQLIDSMSVSTDKLSGNLDEHQTRLHNMSDNIKDNLQQTASMGETLHSQLTKSFDLINQTIGDQQSHVTSSLSEASKNMTSQSEHLVSQYNQFALGLPKLNETIESTFKHIDSQISLSQKQLVSTLLEKISNLEENISNNAQSNQSQFNQQVAQFDQAMGKEVEAIIEGMGQALTTITTHFTKDYEKLVYAMYDVIQQREKVDS